jgi:phosphoesterase RecJ-like protein
MSLDLDAVARIRAQLDIARRILLVTHVDPDGDAIGSLLGLGWLLRGLGKEVTLHCQDPVPEHYLWLPGSLDIVRNSGVPAPAQPHESAQPGRYELGISLDCSDPQRMGTALSPSLLPLINIDHHVTNTRFGTVNWVEPGSVATAQMVLALADTSGWTLTQPAAVCLLTGIVTDTRGFRTSNVDALAMRSALRLVEAGAPLSSVVRQTLEQRPLTSVQLWGEAIGDLRLEDGILWTEVTRSLIQRWGAPDDASSGLINFLTGVREAKVIAVFTERGDGVIDVGLRSAPGYDVAQVALRLGGGGHPQASGCTLQGRLERVRERVLREVRSSLAGPYLSADGSGINA